ncbi:FMN-binding domain-containing protein [Rubritalea squalenifaciens DSM 18772]|uniref:FMN-binding domain-containing protein n=1 Tax=Rubritalea squalenifaciens DSM 18772 TaxID=1123071 RepID=A0A1M6HM81_9BACT|nr:FMN-binding protein [Rubritalea squalenifaciens]SHJ23353.1 FMN-binding domain-containing protein [Rubritalea squalenifaciens DSM 18772]
MKYRLQQLSKQSIRENLLRVVLLFGVALLCMPATLSAATTYEKPSDYLKRHFGAIPKTKAVSLQSKDLKRLNAIMGHSFGQKQVRYWESGGKRVWILNEIGKTEPITTAYLVESGKITEVKVLVYRESHGWEVSRPFFTKQFKGATLKGNELSTDIDGIVGATLSVRALKKMGAAALYLNSLVSK